uniref:Uncharacterized protein n=1 Tax=Ditylenchus dipsaci TaxID=166011 RepID=A0A915ERA1_9BILA
MAALFKSNSLFFWWSSVLLLLSLASTDRAEEIAVHGSIRCAIQIGGELTGYMMANANVYLQEYDAITDHDELDFTTTNENGSFAVMGSQWELMEISPFLLVQHSCPTFGLPQLCVYQTKFELPPGVSNLNAIVHGMTQSILPRSAHSMHYEAGDRLLLKTQHEWKKCFASYSEDVMGTCDGYECKSGEAAQTSNACREDMKKDNKFMEYMQISGDIYGYSCSVHAFVCVAHNCEFVSFL